MDLEERIFETSIKFCIDWYTMRIDFSTSMFFLVLDFGGFQDYISSSRDLIKIRLAH